MTLEPSLSPSQFLRVTKLESAEDPRIRELLKNTTSSLSQQYPDRYSEPLVINMEGKTCLINRYIRTLNPPPGLIRDDMPIKQKMVKKPRSDILRQSSLYLNKIEFSPCICQVLLARYVSLIPTVCAKALHPESFDIWLTNKVSYQVEINLAWIWFDKLVTEMFLFPVGVSATPGWWRQGTRPFTSQLLQVSEHYIVPSTRKKWIWYTECICLE